MVHCPIPEFNGYKFVWFLIFRSNLVFRTHQGGRGHWAVSYTGTQSFIATLAQYLGYPYQILIGWLFLVVS